MATEPCTFVVFGATGHLARTKLLPAMYHLEEVNRQNKRNFAKRRSWWFKTGRSRSPAEAHAYALW